MLENFQIALKKIQQDILKAEDYQQIKPSEHSELLLKLIELPDEKLAKQCAVMLLLTINPYETLKDEASQFFYNIVKIIEPQQFELIYKEILKAKQALRQPRATVLASVKTASVQLMPPKSVQDVLVSIERIKLKIADFFNENSGYFSGYQEEVFNTNSPLVITLLFDSYMAEQRRAFPSKDLYLLEPFTMQLKNLRRGSEYNILLGIEDAQMLTEQFVEQASEILESAKPPSITDTPLNSQRQAVRQHLDTMLSKPQAIKTEHTRSRSFTVKSASHLGESATIKTLIKDKNQLLAVVQGLTKSLSQAHGKSDSAFGYKEVLQKIYDLCHSEILTKDVKAQLENNLAKLVHQFCALYISAIAATETQETSLLDSVLKQLKIFINFYKQNYKNTDVLYSHSKDQIEFLQESKHKVINSNFAEFSTVLLSQIQTKELVDNKLDEILFKEGLGSSTKTQARFVNKLEGKLQRSLPAKEQAIASPSKAVNPKRESLSSKEHLAMQTDNNAKPNLPARNATPQFLNALENSLQQPQVKEQKLVSPNMPVNSKRESVAQKDSFSSYLQSWWGGDNNAVPVTTQTAKELSQPESKTSAKQGLASAGLLAEMRKKQGSAAKEEGKNTDNTSSSTPQLR